MLYWTLELCCDCANMKHPEHNTGWNWWKLVLKLRGSWSHSDPLWLCCSFGSNGFCKAEGPTYRGLYKTSSSVHSAPGSSSKRLPCSRKLWSNSFYCALDILGICGDLWPMVTCGDFGGARTARITWGSLEIIFIAGIWNILKLIGKVSKWSVWCEVPQPLLGGYPVGLPTQRPQHWVAQESWSVNHQKTSMAGRFGETTMAERNMQKDWKGSF